MLSTCAQRYVQKSNYFNTSWIIIFNILEQGCHNCLLWCTIPRTKLAERPRQGGGGEKQPWPLHGLGWMWCAPLHGKGWVLCVPLKVYVDASFFVDADGLEWRNQLESMVQRAELGRGHVKLPMMTTTLTCLEVTMMKRRYDYTMLIKIKIG